MTSPAPIPIDADICSYCWKDCPGTAIRFEFMGEKHVACSK